MITSLYLEGFKSFGKPVTIDFREITLLYGENSSGKSSILQALQYAREVFCNGNLDCLKTEIGGDFVDLRGFRNFVHGRDESRSVKIGITVAICNESLAKFCLMDSSAAWPFARWAIDNLPLHETVEQQLRWQIVRSPGPTESKTLTLPTSKYLRKTTQMQVVVKIRLSTDVNQNPEMTDICVCVDNQPLIEVSQKDIETNGLNEKNESKSAQCSLFYQHKLIPPAFPNVEKLDSLCETAEFLECTDLIDCEVDDDSIGSNDFNFDKKDQTKGELPDSIETHSRHSNPGAPITGSFQPQHDLNNIFAQAEQDATAGWRDRIEAIAQGEAISWLISPSDIDLKELYKFSDNWPVWPLSEIIWEVPSPRHNGCDINDEGEFYLDVFSRTLGVCDLRDLNYAAIYAGSFMIQALNEISGHLSAMQYIGPLRRHYSPPAQHRNKSDERSWADGLGAWDHLFNSPDSIGLVNKWLSDQSLFGFDCTVQTSTNLQVQADEILLQIDDENAEKITRIMKDLDAGEQVIIKSKDGYRLNSTDVGVGFSQVLPIIVAARGLACGCILLEQPELHIHVRLQAVLGDLLATSLERNGYGDLKRQFIVETHSEALLLRLMRRIRETTKEIVSNGPRLLCDHVAVYHISKQDGNSIAKRIELDTYGNLTDEWPDDLFEIGYKERFGE